jgi:hypothetical protein
MSFEYLASVQMYCTLTLLFSHEDWVRVALRKYLVRFEPAASEVKGKCANHLATEAPKCSSFTCYLCGCSYPGARGYLFSPGLNIPSGEIDVVFRVHIPHITFKIGRKELIGCRL